MAPKKRTGDSWMICHNTRFGFWVQVAWNDTPPEIDQAKIDQLHNQGYHVACNSTRGFCAPKDARVYAVMALGLLEKNESGQTS